MKDLFGKDIELGDYVIYIVSASSQHFEKAVVLEKEETFIKIEYLGICSSNLSHLSCYTKEQGKKSKLTVTDKKIIVINSLPSDEKNVYRDERDRLYKQIKDLQSKVLRSYDREKKLTKKNKSLEAEVDRIHNRFDILDL